MEFDFEGLNRVLLSRVGQLLPRLLPGGKVIGSEYTIGDITGSQGKSFKVNTQTGKWADFGGGPYGEDLISLYAEIEGINQGQAYKKLAELVGYDGEAKKRHITVVAKQPDLTAPPPGQAPPVMQHKAYGQPSKSWIYRAHDGTELFHVARYDVGKRKEFLPFSWHGVEQRWVCKAWPQPRPLYGLDELYSKPDAFVMVVEGEKACDAARGLLGDEMVAITWPGGAKAWGKADWSALKNRAVVIWPDADKPGRDAADGLARALKPQVERLAVVDVSGMPDGWDAADAASDGFNLDDLTAWMEPRLKMLKTVEPPAEKKEEPEKEEVSSMYAMHEGLGLALSNGKPVCNIANVLKVLESEQFKDLVWYDEFHHKYRTEWGGKGVREWGHIDDLNLTVLFQSELGFLKVEDGTIHRGVQLVGRKRTRNEPRDWMEKLTWDGSPRLDDLFFVYFDVGQIEDKGMDYYRAVARNWWISMVARVLRPGCKVDNMIILEGGQGIKKSTALDIIGGPWYAEVHESVTSKDFYMHLHGKFLVEISELDAFSRGEVNSIKKVITCRVDRYRPPYGRVSEDFPRQCIFAGTTNDDIYLKDPTGARRFWPVKVKAIHVDKLREDREQLFAEAVHRFKLGETWFEIDDDLAQVQQGLRQDVDPWEEKILQYVTGRESVTILDVATCVTGINLEVGKVDKVVTMRIGKVLHRLRWSRKQLRVNGRRTYVYLRQDD